MRNKSYDIISYGGYSEKDFISRISRAKRGIVIDDTESQGLAIQEMMSCNLPLLVWDVKEWTHYGEKYKCDATSVPYFDETCGRKFYNREEIEETFDTFMGKNYNPRDYILHNLTLSKKAHDIVNVLYQQES